MKKLSVFLAVICLAVLNLPAQSTNGTSKSAEEKGSWTTTASGLKYQVLKKGTGTVSPKSTDIVRVNYEGRFLDSTVFDASAKHGGVTQFPLDRVIKGWTEGIQLMKVGDKFKFEIPADLAYGAAGRPGIPPNSTLIFEVELVGIGPAPRAQ